jgi:uncharacterized protein YbjT (DUF2867 family)
MIGRSGYGLQLAEGWFPDLGLSENTFVFSQLSGPFRRRSGAPIPELVKLRPSTLDRIADAFAEAIARGDFAAAEGWVVAARYVADREALRAPAARRIGRKRGATPRSWMQGRRDPQGLLTQDTQ